MEAGHHTSKKENAPNSESALNGWSQRDWNQNTPTLRNRWNFIYGFTAHFRAGAWPVLQQYTPLTLRAWSTEHGPASAELVGRWGARLADALGALHAAGLLHRDVNPDLALRDCDANMRDNRMTTTQTNASRLPVNLPKKRTASHSCCCTLLHGFYRGRNCPRSHRTHLCGHPLKARCSPRQCVPGGKNGLSLRELQDFGNNKGAAPLVKLRPPVEPAFGLCHHEPGAGCCTTKATMRFRLEVASPNFAGCPRG
jgi:serine/threonine protein kinase